MTDQWRYRSPCCGHSSVYWRPKLGVWFCLGCRDHCERLVDAKTGDRVTRQEVRRA